MKRKFTVEKQQNLIAFLSDRLAGVPRDRLKIQLKRGEVRVNGKKVLYDVPLNVGDLVDVFLPAKFDERRIEIVYEDDNIIAVDKPPFVESEKQLPELIYEQTGKKVWAAHRLDTNTTGILLLCKDKSALDALTEAFKTGGIHKTYVARVFGCPAADQGTLTAYLKKNADSAFCTVHASEIAGSKKIVTAYKVLFRGEQSVLELSPLTGRTHQLRAHMAYIGCPIVGDEKYGDSDKNKQVGAKIQKLRAVKIVFSRLQYPIDGLNDLEISVPIGKDIAPNK